MLQKAEVALRDIVEQAEQHLLRDQEQDARLQQQGAGRTQRASRSQQRQLQHAQHELRQQRRRQQREGPVIVRQVATSVQRVAQLLGTVGAQQHRQQTGAKPQSLQQGWQVDEQGSEALEQAGSSVAEQPQQPLQQHALMRRLANDLQEAASILQHGGNQDHCQHGQALVQLVSRVSYVIAALQKEEDWLRKQGTNEPARSKKRFQ